MKGVVCEILSESRGHLRIEHSEVDFVIDAERAVVEVGGSDHAPYAIDNGDLGVNHGRFIFIDLSSAFQQIAVSASARAARQAVIAMLARNNDLNRYTALFSAY